MANKAKKIMITPKEKTILDQASLEVNITRQNLSQSEAKLRQALELVGDRYDVNLLGGEYQITGEGEISKRNNQMSESGTTEKQLLQE